MTSFPRQGRLRLGASHRCFTVRSKSVRNIPFDDKDHVGDGSVIHSAGQRGYNRGVRDIDTVAGGVAHTGHIAAGIGRGDKRLRSSIGSVSLNGNTAADGECKAELVGIYLFAGKSGLVTERGEFPASGSGDGDRLSHGLRP